MRKLLGIALALTLAAAGCGDDEPEGAKIPADRAEAITNQLDAIQDQADRGNCGSASFQAREVSQKIDGLPDDVSQEVRDALTDGAERLQSAIESDCEQPEETTTEETTPETTTETQPETTQPETTTETQPDTTTETQPETTTDEQPPPDTPPGDGGTPPGQDGGGAGIPGDDGDDG